MRMSVQAMTMWLRERFSLAGLLLAVLFFAASLTPSLLPRDHLLQGVLSGCAAAAGYGVGVLAAALWDFLELPKPAGGPRLSIIVAAGGAALAISAYFLWQAADWQNSIRGLMGLEPVETASPFYVALVAAAVFLLLTGAGRLFVFVFRAVSGRLKTVIPRRTAQVLGIAFAVLLFVAVIDGVIFRYALRAADASFARLDQLIEDGIERPQNPLKTGSSASLIDWGSLGRAGREFIATGPGAAEIAAFGGAPAREPIRVYAGLSSADTAEERASLAFEELKRAGGFERSVLVVAVPTGTGWLDPAAMDTLEYLHGGDVASVAIQYSYLTSWLSLLVEPGYGAEAAQSLFARVYAHWKTLPKATRPRLYLYGLSLGAYNSEQSAEIFDILADPFHGALWAGPPFPSRFWQWTTRNRNAGSPAWLPRVRDGSLVRFTGQRNALDIPGATWGPMRIVYLQYASDPVTFFDPYAAYREPAWMLGERGPDVSPDLSWYPVVTFLQLLLDMATATTAPIGHGHLYAPEHYIDAWVAVTEPANWSEQDSLRLKEAFADFGR